jgi:hypothetical protein
LDRCRPDDDSQRSISIARDFFISGTAKNVIIDVRNEDTPFSEDIDFPCRRREGFCLTFAPAVRLPAERKGH